MFDLFALHDVLQVVIHPPKEDEEVYTRPFPTKDVDVAMPIVA